eukprot:UN14768
MKDEIFQKFLPPFQKFLPLLVKSFYPTNIFDIFKTIVHDDIFLTLDFEYCLHSGYQSYNHLSNENGIFENIILGYSQVLNVT